MATDVIGNVTVTGGNVTSFAVGDVVRLKSGGPAMTVGATRNDVVACYWNRDDNALLDAQFPADALVHVAAPPQDAGEIEVTEAMRWSGWAASKLEGVTMLSEIEAIYRAMEKARRNG